MVIIHRSSAVYFDMWKFMREISNAYSRVNSKKKRVSRFQRRQRQRGRMRCDGSTYVILGSAGLHRRKGLYLRANKMLLLQLRQHSRLRDSGVRGEIIHVTKIHNPVERKERERERERKRKGRVWVMNFVRE